jgi:hypothetical protein
MPNESRRERLMRYLAGRMATIKKSGNYWHDATRVIRRHPTLEQLKGDDGFVVSIQAADMVTDPQARKSGKDEALAEIVFRGHQKLTTTLDAEDMDTQGERMLRDIFMAFFSGDLGMDCQAITSWIMEAKATIDTGIPGWITCEAKVVVKYALVWTDP